MFLRNSWYVAAWDYEIGQDGLFHRRILNESILLYRTADGSVVALDNRCCHRHAPLSAGRKEGDCVRCMYHGLKYDPTGRCIEVPGQTVVPSVLQVRSYPVLESGRWVWIWMGDPTLADPALIPDTHALDHPDWRGKPGYMHYDANYLLISDNLLDFSHLSYVHAATLGGSERIAETLPKVERLTRGVKVSRHVANSPIAPYQAGFANFTGPVNRYWIYEYLVPGILLMDSGSEPVDLEKTPGARPLRFKGCQALTPESLTTTHYFFMQAHGFALDDESVTLDVYQSIVAAFQEDRRMIEAQQAMITASTPREFIALRSDTALAHFRKVLDELLESEAQRSAG